MYLLNIIPIAAFLGKAFFLGNRLKIALPISMPVTASITIILLYISAYLGLIFYATLILYLFGLWALYNTYIQKQNSYLFEQSTTAITLFVISIIIIGFYYQPAQLNSTEDLKIWGLFLKELLLRGSIETSSSDTSIISAYSYYPRGSSVFQYYYMMLNGYFGGGALFAHFLLGLCFLSPFLQTGSSNHSIFYIVIIVAIGSLLTSFLHTIHNEVILGLAGSSAILTYLLDRKNANLQFGLYPIILTTALVDHNGFIFGTICALLISADYAKKKKLNIFTIDSKTLKIYALTLSPLIASYINYFLYSVINLTTETSIDAINTEGGNNFGGMFRVLGLLFFTSIKEGPLLCWLLLYIGYYWTKREDLKTHYTYCFWIKFTIFALGFHIVYLLYSFYGHYTELHIGKIIRYIAPYLILLGTISLFFISLVSFAQRGALLFNIISIFSLAVTLSHLDMAPNVISLEEDIMIRQIHSVQDLIKSKQQVHLSYENKSKDYDCYDFAFKMAPYITESEISRCLQSNIDFHNVYLGKLITMPAKLETGYIILYKPFLLNYEIIADNKEITPEIQQ